MHKNVDDCCTYRNCIRIDIHDENDENCKPYSNIIWYEYYNVVRKGKNLPHKVIEKPVESSAQLTFEDYEDEQKLKLLNSPTWRSLFDAACEEIDFAESCGYHIKDYIFKNYSFYTLHFLSDVRKVLGKVISEDIENFVTLS